MSLGETNCDIINIEDNSASDDRSEVHEAEQNIRIEDNSASDDISEVHHAEKHLEESSSTKTPMEYVVLQTFTPFINLSENTNNERKKKT